MQKKNEPAADSKRSALAPTLDAPQQACRPAQLQSSVTDGADKEVEIILHHVASRLEHDVYAKGAAEARRGPVEVVGSLLLEAVLDNENPDPHGCEYAAGNEEAEANASLLPKR